MVVLAAKYTNLKDRHLVQSTKERAKFYDHNNKARNGGKTISLHKYVSIIIDGMDQEKTCLPHFDRNPKYIDGQDKIELHLNGVMIVGHGVTTINVHWNYKHQFKDDANALMNVLDHSMREIQAKREAAGEPQPSVLYLQLDNVSSNKNHWLLAYAAWLVHTGVLDKVKVGFLLVGHTHENITTYTSSSLGLQRR